MATSSHDSKTVARSLWLHATWEKGSRVFEFPADGSRAIAVGSYRQSDIRVTRPGFPPIAFCFERQGDFILVAPMASGDLRLNGSRVIEPWPLVGGAVLEFAAARIDVTVLMRRPPEEVPADQATTRETQLNYLKRLPDEKDTTKLTASAVTNTRDIEATNATVEMAPLELELETFPTEVMPQFHFWDEAPAPAAPDAGGDEATSSSPDAITTALPLRPFSNLLAPASSPPAGVFTTERVHLAVPAPEVAPVSSPTPTFDSASRFGESAETKTFGTVEFYRNAPTRSDPIPPLPQRIVRPAAAVGDLSVSTEDTTAFELESLEAPKASTVTIGPRHEDADERFLQLGEANRAATPMPPSERRVGAVLTAWLARLGVRATERPLRVATIGLGGALISILVLIGIHRVVVSKKLPALPPTVAATAAPTPRPTPATRVPETRPTASEPMPSAAAAQIAAERPAPVAALRQVSSPVIRAATSALPRSGLLPAARTDSDAVTALKYLVDGRDADALRAYSALATRSPENYAYQALTRLLRRRASQSCSGTPALSASCPEVKR